MKKRYDSYKPSGIDWIGDIPSHWEVLPLKRQGTMNTGLTFTKADLVESGDAVISYGQIHSGLNDKVHIKPELIRYIPKSISKSSDSALVSKGSFIFADTSEDREGCGNAVYIDTSDKIYAGYHTIVFRRNDENGKYLAYLFQTDAWRSQIRSQVSGVKVYSITQTILSSTLVILPPGQEQEAIAAWLDEKCGEIDAAIAKVDREIELIDELKQSEISRVVTRGLNPDAPLRPSGIDWIGDIPKHWKMCRFKNFMYLKTTPSVSDIKVGLENLESGSGKFIESDTEFEGNGVEFGTNNILYGKLRPYLKKVWLAEFSGNAIGDFFVFSNCPNSNASYLKYVLLSDGFTKQADGSTFGAKMPRVSSEFILTLPFYLPPLAEQQAIADYLDKKCAEIDGLKAKLNRKRETLTELRQSIISEIVTGKRKVI